VKNFIKNDRVIKKELTSNPDRTGENPDIFYIKMGEEMGERMKPIK